LLDCFEHVSWLGDTRQVNLRLRSRIAALTAECATPDSLKVGSHTLGFVEFQRTRMRFLLGNADVVENIQNCPALNFQFAR